MRGYIDGHETTLHFQGTEKSGGAGGPAVLFREADIALYLFTRMLVVLVGQMMAARGLHLSRNLMMPVILTMGKFGYLSSFERGRKAIASNGYLTLLSVVI